MVYKFFCLLYMAQLKLYLNNNTITRGGSKPQAPYVSAEAPATRLAALKNEKLFDVSGRLHPVKFFFQKFKTLLVLEFFNVTWKVYVLLSYLDTIWQIFGIRFFPKSSANKGVWRDKIKRKLHVYLMNLQ